MFGTAAALLPCSGPSAYVSICSGCKLTCSTQRRVVLPVWWRLDFLTLRESLRGCIATGTVCVFSFSSYNLFLGNKIKRKRPLFLLFGFGGHVGVHKRTAFRDPVRIFTVDEEPVIPGPTQMKGWDLSCLWLMIRFDCTLLSNDFFHSHSNLWIMICSSRLW